MFDGTYEICSSKIKPIAEKLIAKYDELRHIKLDNILFLLNHKALGSKKRVVLAKTSKVPPKWQEILDQLGAVNFEYMMEFYEKTSASLDENQMVALVYRELRRIGREGEVAPPEVHEWYNVLIGLGRHWFYPDSTCPNLLDDSVDWRKLMGSSYEQPLPSD